MTNSNDEYLIKRLDRPRASITAQGFSVIKEFNMIKNEDEFFFRFVQDRGDEDKSGKRAALAIAGGGVDVVSNVIIGGVTHHNFIERDLLDVPFGFRLISLNGELIEKKKNLSTLLRRYDFGSRLPLEVEQNGDEDNITVIPVRDETPDEGGLREFESETGQLAEVVPPKDGMAYYPYLPEDRRKDGWLPSKHGEIMVEINNDYLKNDYPGIELKHFLYTFHLKEVAENKNGNGEQVVRKIREVDEIRGVQKIALDLLMLEIYKKDLCMSYNNREGNPEGFYPSHAIRVMNCLWILGISYKEHLPKVYNPDLKQAQFRTLRSFLPEEIDFAIVNGKFDFNGGSGKHAVKPPTSTEAKSILPSENAAAVSPDASVEEDDDFQSRGWNEEAARNYKNPVSSREVSADDWAKYAVPDREKTNPNPPKADG